MDKKVDVRSLGRVFLLGASVGVPLAGCETSATTGMNQASAAASGNAEYNAALSAQDPVLVTRFITANGGDRQSAALLNQMPPQVLAEVSCPAVRNLAPDVQRDLSARVQAQCGLTPPTAAAAQRPIFSSS